MANGDWSGVSPEVLGMNRALDDRIIVIKKDLYTCQREIRKINRDYENFLLQDRQWKAGIEHNIRDIFRAINRLSNTINLSDDDFKFDEGDL